MKDYWLPQNEWDSLRWQNEQDPAASINQILKEERFQVHYVDGVPITGRDYPVCLESDAFECDLCEFFFDDECRLRRSKAYREAVWEVIEPWVEQEREKGTLRQAVADQLESHGRALHYSVIARMIRQRYPHLEATEARVLRVLYGCPELFEQLGPGLYKRAEKR